MPHLSTSSANPAFTGVYVFGDSLVDPGNALKAADLIDNIPFVSLPDGAPTADKGYFEGRFTDGYNFADLISNKLLSAATKTTFPYGFEDPLFGLDIPFVSRPAGVNLSFAYGGAQAIQGDEPVPDLDDQTDAYRNYPAADPNALYIVTIGGNDIRELVPRLDEPVLGAQAASRLNAIADEIVEEVGQLYSFGARHVLVTGMPDVGLIPQYSGFVNEAARRSLATQYSQQLDGLVKAKLGGMPLPEGAKLYAYSFLDFSARVFADPGAYGLANLTQARILAQSGALEPVGSGFLFFDQVHPSAQAHALVAGEILDSLRTPAAAASAVSPQPGPRIQAVIEAAGLADLFTASLVAGQSYVFDLLGISSGSGSLPDPMLRIFGPTGERLAEDDDLGLGLDAHLTFVAPATGDYTIQVAGVGVSKGTYVLQGPDLRGSDVRVSGGPSDDTIGAISGTNYLRGEEGDDSLVGGSGFDDINGNTGDDTVQGGAGDDWAVGGKDNDRLYGEDGDDVVYGNLGNNTCEGGSGADSVRGGQGDDLVTGGDGDDWLAGDLGADTMAGGAGADIFHTHGGAGLDRVLDFNRAEGDRVSLTPGTEYIVAQVGPDVVVSMTGGGQMVLVGIQITSLSGEWIF